MTATTMEVFKNFTFEAAHRLPHVPAEHKCARLHGHTFSVEVRVRGTVGSISGWVKDFADLDSAFRPLLDSLDHTCLNEIEGLENPTSENLARWIWIRLQPALPGLCRVTVQENCTCGCIYRGEEDQ
jgi:6-pyruvoyltetrahydropterin/6-carboxytetrahydropterin synthase